MTETRTEVSTPAVGTWSRRPAWIGIAAAVAFCTACGAGEVKPSSSEAAAKQLEECTHVQEICAQSYPPRCMKICLDDAEEPEPGPEDGCPSLCSSEDPDSCQEYCANDPEAGDPQQGDDATNTDPTKSDEEPTDECQWLCTLMYPPKCYAVCPSDGADDPAPGSDCVIGSDGTEECPEPGDPDGDDGEPGTT